MILFVLLAAVAFVAFTNGANANFKGVASLYGSGTTSLRTAAYWGTATTFVGSVTALLFVAWNAQGMQQLLDGFVGRKIVPEQATSKGFLGAIALAAAATSFLATRLGFPVSTTHALVGGLVGAGLASGSEVHFDQLAGPIVLPLFVSPFVAVAFGAIVYPLLRLVRLLPDQRTRTLDVLHFLSAGAASFARGLNDTPKIVAPLLVVEGLPVHWAFLFVAVAIAVGGLLDIRNVAETLAKKLTGMSPSQGFAACFATATLVNVATVVGLPVSTTHISVGSLLGMGVVTRQARWRKVWEILLAWVTTVPCGAVLAAAFYWLLRLI